MPLDAAIVVGLVAAGLALWLVFASILRTTVRGVLFDPLTLFFGMAVVDVLVPGTVFLVVAAPSFPGFMRPLSPVALSNGLVVFCMAATLFAAGFLAMSPQRGSSRSAIITPLTVSATRRVLILLAVLFSLNLAARGLEVAQFGSVAGWIEGRTYARWRSGTPAALSYLAIPSMVAFHALSGLLFVRREQYKHPWVYGMVLPLAGWFLTLPTFYRGTQLVYFLGLGVLESMRSPSAGEPGRFGMRRALGPAALIVLAFISFVGYGVLRRTLTENVNYEASSAVEALAGEARRLVRGEGLIGLSSIVDQYTNPAGRLFGKTFKDGLLSFIPRAVWPEKPAWYGVTDVTRRLGWPESTQNAVTMPGELIANFGMGGILLMLVWGAVYGLLERLRFVPAALPLYAFAVLPSVLPAFWMGSTGFVSSVRASSVAVLLLLFALRLEQVGGGASPPDGS